MTLYALRRPTLLVLFRALVTCTICSMIVNDFVKIPSTKSSLVPKEEAKLASFVVSTSYKDISFILRVEKSNLNYFFRIAKCSNETVLLTFQSLCDCNRNVTNTMRDVFENDLQTCMPVLLNQTTSIVVSDAFRQVAENTCFLVPEDPCDLKKGP